MRSIRVQISFPIFLLSAACGVFFTIYSLSSLHNEVALKIETAINAEWRDVVMYVVKNGPERLGDRELAGKGNLIEVLLFDSTGTAKWRKNKSQFVEVSTLQHVLPPPSFLESRAVGLVFRATFEHDERGVVSAALMVTSAPYVSQYRSARSRTLLLAFILTIGMSGVALVLSGRVADRIVKLQVSAGKLTGSESATKANGGDFDEVDRLAGILETTYHKLERNKLEIERLQQIRSQFLANVSHEVRTPLFSLKGYLETLQDGGIDDPKVNRAFVDSAYRQAHRLDALLKDLIEISRIESGEMRMSFRYFPVVPMLNQLLDENQIESVRKKQSITVRAPGSEMEIIGDRERLKQALSNLVDNAIKYSPEGSKIVVGAAEKPDGVVLSVTDNGPGIAPEHLPRLFERFYRVDVDRSREVGGTGLGLAIVKHIVEAHDAKMHVTSELGKGTSFFFEIRK